LYLALSTIGVYQQHDVCWASTRRVRSCTTMIEDGYLGDIIPALLNIVNC